MEGKKLKILMTADTLGGVWNYATDLCQGLGNYPMQCHLAVLGSYMNKNQREQVKSIPNLKVYESGYKLEWMHDPWDEVEKACRWIKDIHDYIKPDIVHFNNYGQAHCDWKTPTILVAHSCVLSWWKAVKSEEAPPEWDRYRNRVKQALLNADLVVSPTLSFLRDLENTYGNIVHKKVIHNGRNLPDAYHIPQKEPIILSAGRVWDEAKNTGSLMKVANHLEWPIFIAGESGHPVTKESVKTDNIHYLGHLSQDELWKWMQKASVYVLPAHYEPFGLSVLEAARFGCALLLGDIGSLRELWDGAADFVDQRNTESIAAALDKLVHDEIRREKLAVLAKERAQRYTLKTMVQEYYNTYKMLLPEPAKTGKVTTPSNI